jgi:glycosyltransferase involved in cell wall biosynthesis
MKVSVIIRTFNRPLLLKQSLASINLQTYTNWEVIIFDDGDGNEDTISTINNFRSQNPNNTVLYFNSNSPRYFFKKSWEIAPLISQGEVMIRLDDDDLLTETSLEFISETYTNNPLLDYSYGSCATFNKEGLIGKITTQTPLEVPKVREIWAGYLEGYPWNNPYNWVDDYYDKPRHYTSIIHCSKASIMCSYAPYVIRTSSAVSVLNKFKVTSFVDDLEVMGSLDYLGLRHTSIKSILSYVREHDKGRVTDSNKAIRDELEKVRDKVEYLRPNNFTSNVYLESIENDNREKEINENDKISFKQYYNKVEQVASKL